MLMLCLVAVPGQAKADGIEVIVSPEHAGIALDRDQLRAIFTMRVRTWPDGEPLRVFVMPDNSDIHSQFCREQLGIYPYILRSAWDRLVYTGTGFAPETVRSENEMKQEVKTTPGAIGYIRRASSPDPNKSKPRRDEPSKGKTP